MADAAPPISRLRAAGHQTTLSALIAACVLGAVLIPQPINDHDDWVQRADCAAWQRSPDEWFQNRRMYPNLGDHLIYQELPRADYSHGGTYLIGASGMMMAVDPLAMIDAEREGIHNYCQAAMIFSSELHFVRFLIDEQGLLRAGGEQSRFLIGVSFSDTEHGRALEAGALSYSFTHHRMYTYDSDAGIHAVPMSPLWRDCLLLHIRAQAFWTWTAGQLKTGVRDLFGRPARHKAEGALDPALFGPDWRAGAAIEFKRFNELIDLLQSHGCPIAVVYLPERQWARDFPQAQNFRALILPMLAQKGIPVTDLKDILPEADFSDSMHPNYQGAQVISPLILDAAEKLRSAPAITAAPATGAATTP